MFKIALKFVLLPALLVGFLWQARRAYAGAADESVRRSLGSYLVHRWARRTVGPLGLRIAPVGSWPRREGRELAVCNHMSYIDVILLSSVRPLVFVTSVEVRDSGFLGTICRLGGCLFVERRRRASARADSAQMAAAMDDRPVVLFPEGTSGDGRRVLPFRSSLFAAAVDAGAEVRPLCLRYARMGFRRFARRNHRAICWYGDMTFLPHLLRFLATPTIDVALRFLPPLAPSTDRKSLCRRAEGEIRRSYGVDPSP